MTDIYLYPGETNPFDIRLRDPTTADAGEGDVGYVPPAVAEPTSWRPKQRGYVDLFVNVAVLAVSAIVVTRAPVYVTAPAKRWTQVQHVDNRAVHTTGQAQIRPLIEPTVKRQRFSQPDIFPNIAVVQTPKVRTYIDPVTWKSKWRQPDVYPNIAAVQTPKIRIYVDPVTWKARAQQLDLTPNLAARVTVVVVAPTPVEPTPTKRRPPQVDTFPNIAGAQNEAAAITRGATYQQYRPSKWTQIEPPVNLAARSLQTETRIYVDPVTWRARSRQPDLAPNLAVRVTVVTRVAPAPLEPILTRRLAPQVDLYPNLAGAQDESPAVTRAPSYTPYKRTRWTQVDVPVNVSVSGITVVARVVPAQVDAPTVRRRTQQPELFPNLAAPSDIDVFVVSADDALTTRRWPLIDLYPNLAARFSEQAQRVVPVPIEPQITKRRPPQVDVYRDNAIHAPLETLRVPPLLVEPTRLKRPPPQLDYSFNIAIGFATPVIYDVRIRLGLDEIVVLGLSSSVIKLGVNSVVSLGVDTVAIIDVDQSTVTLGVYS